FAPTIPNLQNWDASLNEAYQQLQIYKQDIPKLFYYNQLLVISDGTQARVGTITSDWEQFMPWLTIDGEDFSLLWADELEVLVQGIFDKRRFLDLVKNFILFERNGATIHKKMADYQQFYSVRSPLAHQQHHSHPKERNMCHMIDD
ncbi:MAG TPA: DEAD/DEAH box helicase, partial [Cyanobacteria bacterium UBA8543]|nr:DEAD/DEAH box helicase [Cyanobacteria bacterium UBA8543]